MTLPTAKYQATECPDCKGQKSWISAGKRDIGFAFVRYHTCACGFRYKSVQLKDEEKVRK